MPPVSTARLLALRALYALIAAGLGAVTWSGMFGAVPNPSSVVRALLGSLALMALLGVRYPLQMLPVLLFELLWKLVWVLAIALPAWRQGQLGVFGTATLYECLPAFVLLPLTIPWRYVAARYLRAPGEPWRGPSAG